MRHSTRAALALALLVALVTPSVLAACTLEGGFTFHHPTLEGGPGMFKFLKGSQVRTPAQCRNKCDKNRKCFGYVHNEIDPSGSFGNSASGHTYNCQLYDSRVKNMPQDQEAPGAVLYYEKRIYGGRCW